MNESKTVLDDVTVRLAAAMGYTSTTGLDPVDLAEDVLGRLWGLGDEIVKLREEVATRINETVQLHARVVELEKRLLDAESLADEALERAELVEGCAKQEDPLVDRLVHQTTGKHTCI